MPPAAFSLCCSHGAVWCSLRDLCSTQPLPGGFLCLKCFSPIVLFPDRLVFRGLLPDFPASDRTPFLRPLTPVNLIQPFSRFPTLPRVFLPQTVSSRLAGASSARLSREPGAPSAAVFWPVLRDYHTASGGASS